MRMISSLLRPSPFKIGCLVLFIAGAIFFSFGGRKPVLLQRLDNQIIDAMFHWRGKMPTTNSVVIVDLDEKSMRKIGQWPWPRDIIAQLISKITAAHPKAIGLDTFFPEADRTSPKNSIKELAPLLNVQLSKADLTRLQADGRLDHDLILGDTIADSPTVLGYVFQTMRDGLKDAADKPFPSINLAVEPPEIKFADLTFIPAYRAIMNVPEVEMAQTEGFFNVFPDPAGTVRRVPLFMKMDGLPYPGLALEMLRVGMGINKVIIHAVPGKGREANILGISLAGRFIPTDNVGQIMVNFRGPAKTFPYYSAVDVLQGRKSHELRNKYVLVGTSAAGLLDLRATPFSSVFPGVEVHANLIDNLLCGDPFSSDIYTEIGLTYAVIVVGGLILTALLAYSSPLIGGFGGLLLIVLYLFYGTYHYFFLNNQIIGITYPLVCLFAVFMAVTLFNYFFKEREKSFLQGAFGHYVSPQVVKEIVNAPEKLSLAGEDRELSIFFTDIRGFTTISEGMSSQELGEFMNEYLTIMSDLIMAHNGTVDKYIGDAIMAIWGAPLPDKMHAVNAVRAALTMMNKLAVLRPQWSERGLPFIDIGIGINTGVVSVGNFGSEQRFDYTVIGDNVNLASRLEGQNKVYGTNIIISEFTRAAIGEQFFCRFVDLVKVKGKDKPVALYQPLLEGRPDAKLAANIQAFNEAIELYRARKFIEAQNILAPLNTQSPLKLYALYLERIQNFIEFPPPDNWDGVYTATSK